jgi:hypothetical protein
MNIRIPQMCSNVVSHLWQMSLVQIVIDFSHATSREFVVGEFHNISHFSHSKTRNYVKSNMFITKLRILALQG